MSNALRRAGIGAVSGIAGGIVFGMLMGMMGFLPMVAMLIGSNSAAVGFGVHLVNSALIGAFYGVVFAGTEYVRRHGLVSGLGYGVLWWILGPLFIMPLWLGMPLPWSAAGIAASLPSLMGHMIYGAILGILYGILARRS
ncbi:MAG: hypothetical protein HYX78_14770 [Armatimonadetes bacterium]|nr:hypothetical protein [Armatimonadota bacterium]